MEKVDTPIEATQPAPPPVVTLALTIDEVNGILNVLSEKPFQQVAPIIAKIREQGIEQLQAQGFNTTPPK